MGGLGQAGGSIAGGDGCVRGREGGVLVPLKTMLEVRARERTVEVWVTVVDGKMASRALDAVRKVLPEEGGIDLQHLRRFVKMGDVPSHVCSLFEKKPEVLEQDGLSNDLPKRLLLIGSINAITQTALAEVLSPTIDNPTLHPIHVPLLAPTSQAQASLWSSKYWPTVYKKNNPFGPHPSIVSRAADEIRGDVEKWMRIANEVARQSKDGGLGEPVGVVIVERKNGLARPVAVAGDGRWFAWGKVGGGNVTAHAALRAIAMVAEGLRMRDVRKAVEEEFCTKSTNTTPNDEFEVSNVSSSANPPKNDLRKESAKDTSNNETTIFRDQPLLPLEKQYLDNSDNGDGYLCNNLEIYCTHEPCVMCSMAIVHSRFGRLVLGKRITETGGICADGKLGHGLFWRKELNWTLLAWQWSCSTDDGEIEAPDLNA